MLGSALKSSRHSARALPVFEGVPGDDPPSAESDGWNDAQIQHCVDRHAADVEAARDLLDCHPGAGIHVRPIFSNWRVSRHGSHLIGI